jgi:4-alpha-glucanotransferase
MREVDGYKDEKSLRYAARCRGFQDVFRDGLGTYRRTPTAALAALLRCYQASECDDPSDGVPKVVVGVGGKRKVSFAASGGKLPDDAELVLEDGEAHRLERRAIRRSARGIEVQVPVALPVGVHQLHWRAGRDARITHVLARSASVSQGNGRELAVFLPLHALTSGRSLGIGDLTDLGELVDWSRESGAAYVGTLPLFPTFLDKPFEPSPYRPVSRLFWNEVFVDPQAAIEFDHPSVRAIAASGAWRRQVRAARQSECVDYRLAMEVKRQLLTAMTQVAFENERRRGEIEARARATPDAGAYAQFRAAVEERGGPPPHAARFAGMGAEGYREDVRRFYLYAQFLLQEQMRAIGERGAGRSPLYLDLPVGVHPDGFDVWRHPRLFLSGASVGAPPDRLQEYGQVWALPPMHPNTGRDDGYAHLRQVFRRMLSVAGMLRIDHVMGLHRIYCVPNGSDGRDGAYLLYPKEELYAVLMIEAHRAGAVVVGENLGTVPAAVNRELERRGILGMHVQQFTFKAGRSAIARASEHQLVSLNTHDTATFAGFWKGRDIGLRRKLGATDEHQAQKDRRQRERLRVAITRELRRLKFPAATTTQVCRALLTIEARGPAQVALVNLEDLWTEQRQQNLPGTDREHPNWRQRAASSLEQIKGNRAVRSFLKQLAELRMERG